MTKETIGSWFNACADVCKEMKIVLCDSTNQDSMNRDLMSQDSTNLEIPVNDGRMPEDQTAVAMDEVDIKI